MAENEPIPDIRDIVPPPEVAEPFALWLWVAVGGGAALFVGALTWLMLWRSRRPSQPAPEADPRALALDELHTLKSDYVSIEPREFGTRTVAALRLVLAQRFGEASLSHTPEEFFQRHADELAGALGPERGGDLKDLLVRCDQLRFAPDRDSNSARLPLAEAAIAFVRDLPEPPAPSQQQRSPTLPDDAHPAAA